MVHIPKKLKWNKKSLRILIDFVENINGYRVYNPRSNTVVISRNVIVMENIETIVKIMLIRKKIHRRI